MLVNGQPLVSIIIPLYNAEKYIAETIQSALDQTWPNKEIIIIDDGSTDNSLSIANQYSSQLVTIFSRKNHGASVSRNYGLSKAKGTYIQFLDADDILSPDKIEGQIHKLNGSQQHVALCRVVHFNDGEDYKLKKLVDDDWFCKDSDDPIDFLLKLNSGDDVWPGYGSMVQPNSWLTPRLLIDKAGFWNEFRCPDDDGEFFCRIILASAGIKYSTIGTNYYRKYKNASTLSAQKSSEAYKNLLIAIDSKHDNLKKHTDNPLVDRVFARHYWEIGVAAYPKYKAISKMAIKKAADHNYRGIKYKAGPLGTFLSKIIGWRLVRTLTYLKYKA